MFLTERDIVELTALRHDLHRFPEISGEERETAARVRDFVKGFGPDAIIEHLGGHGLAVVYDSGKPGPTLLFRSELDALPIEELSEIPHRSIIKGKGHLCGHDGHSTILAAMAVALSRQRPGKGRVVLLYQPAEENGAGAAAVIADPRFSEIAPDFAFSLHNLPGMPLGHVALKAGPVNCASRGMLIRLTGKTAHASQPEAGTSPMRAMSGLLPLLTDLAHSMPPDPAFRMATVTHARLGEAAFGIAPGEAEIWVTLRTLTDDRMAELVAMAEKAAHDAAAAHGLQLQIGYHDIFHHCENAPEAVGHLLRAVEAERLTHDERGLPIRASEDFGRFRDKAPSAMFFLGAGEASPALHNPDYDFPDALIATGARVFMRVVRDILG
ncbi:amidohydrolase [Rhizobium sp. RU36D]|uniref:amidohydrolase n=1 Tax=Rhizobium sp. RU36D TaxID=1907415 RepID=UPI0009D819AA|nr:amidohydrolase [Rhizobium sp. RU36D]SMC60558.1 amidohydrolase [Rhizobium sp. RU36D]